MPTEISILGLTLHVYGLLIGLSIIVVLKIAAGYWHDSKDKSETFWDAALVMLGGALIGSRLWHAATDWHLYSSNVWEILYVWQGGLSIIGALVGILVGAYVASKLWYPNVTFFKLIDSVLIGLPYGQAIGRFGNWINQELYGKPTDLPWKIYIDPEKRLDGYQQYDYYHPLFLYEAVLLVMSGLFLWWLSKNKEAFKVGKGQLTIVYLALYGWVRFFLEFLRIDKSSLPGTDVGFNQLVMLCVAVGATVYITCKLLKGK